MRISQNKSNESFKNVGEVEFEVAVGPSEAVEDVRRCKLSCREGLWVGPLCKDKHHNGDYRILFRSCEINFEPPHQGPTSMLFCPFGAWQKI